MSVKTQAARKLVVGMGNEWRGDDGVGLLVARRLRARALAGVTVCELRDDPTRLLEAWANGDLVYLIDAVSSGREPGTVRRWDVPTDSLDEKVFRLSTHGATVADAVELARVLKGLPPRLVIFGIEGKCFRMGCGVSPKVQRGAEQIADRIERELREAAAAETMSLR